MRYFLEGFDADDIDLWPYELYTGYSFTLCLLENVRTNCVFSAPFYWIQIRIQEFIYGREKQTDGQNRQTDWQNP